MIFGAIPNPIQSTRIGAMAMVGMVCVMIMGASRAQIFRHVKFPGALPQFFSGLKISASYAVVGAVVSEWLGGFNGLGVYMTRVKKAYSFDKMFAVIIFIVIISLLLLLAVNIVSRITMPWLQVEKEKNHE